MIVGEFLRRTDITYMLWPYLFFGVIALIITFRLTDVKVESEPVHLKDVKQLLTNTPFILFLLFMMMLTITHRANDSFIGLYIDQLGGGEELVGLSWFVSVISEAAIFATAGWWFRKYHPLVFVIISGVFYSLRWFLFAAADSPMSIIGLQFLHGLTFAVFYLAAFDYISRLVPRLLQSTGHLVYYSVFFGISGIIGSLVGGAVIDAFEAATLYKGMGWLALIGTIALTIYHLLPWGKEAPNN
ncbi:Maltose permease [Lentibacillus sp. JNUCC-1]|nr:Maltose permease [Lentibacillus sp. JNUCC-1]